jgi:hypothetical protein
VLGFVYLMPDCWLEVSLQPEGYETGQLDQDFPWFSLVPERMLVLVPKFHVALHASHAALPMVTLKQFRLNVLLISALNSFRWNAFNAEWARHQDILIDWPSVVT